MLRLFLYAVLVALITALAVWLADHPGRVSVEWLEWRIDTSIAVLIALLTAAVLALAVCGRWLWAALRLPSAWTRRRRDIKLRRGYQALSDGLAAAIGGEAPAARKLASRADKLLGDPTLTMVLSAQTARLSGDKAKARGCFSDMLKRPETATLGLKGLLELALEDNNETEALSLAARALSATSGDSWLADTAFHLAVKTNDLSRALELIDLAAKRKATPLAEAARRRALVWAEQASRALKGGDAANAIRLAKQALKQNPAGTGASVTLAQALAATGHDRRAASALEAAWKHHPTVALARPYADLHPGEDPLARLQRLTKLVATRADAPEADLVLGEAALEAKLWGKARGHLLAAVKHSPNSRLYRLLERLEREEYGNEAAARAWAEEAAKAPADPVWHCASCSAPKPEWSLICPSCGAVDSLTSPRRAPAAALPARPAA